MNTKQILKVVLFPLVLLRRQYLKLLPEWLRHAVQNRQYGLAAFLFRLTIHKRRTPTPIATKPKYNIFTLRKDIFNEDVLVSFGESGKFRIYEIPRRIVKIIAYVFLPRHLTDAKYQSQSPKDDECKKAYREFLIRMWAEFLKFVRVDAVLTGNFAYHAEQELAGALEHLGVPFIVLHKENLKTPKVGELYAESCRKNRCPFPGRKILVYNEIERRAQIEGNIISDERSLVTGVPRFDRIHVMRRELAASKQKTNARPMVLFLFFAKTPKPRDWFEDREWEVLLHDTFLAILKLAQESPDLDVVIKTKDAKGHTDVIKSLVAETGGLPENVRMVCKGDPLQLLVECDVVCGFNTTAVLDALALNKPAVVPRFAEAAKPDYQPFIVDFEDAVEYADSTEEFVVKLRNIAKERRPIQAELSPNAISVLDRWLGNGDGKAAERVREAVLAEITKKDTSNENAERRIF